MITLSMSHDLTTKWPRNRLSFKWTGHNLIGVELSFESRCRDALPLVLKYLTLHLPLFTVNILNQTEFKICIKNPRSNVEKNFNNLIRTIFHFTRGLK